MVPRTVNARDLQMGGWRSGVLVPHSRETQAPAAASPRPIRSIRLVAVLVLWSDDMSPKAPRLARTR
jgi:hypothetical protein